MPAGEKRQSTADWVIVVVALFLPTAITWFYFIALAKAPPAIQQSAYAAVKGIQFALPAVWVWLVQRERLTLPRPRFNGVLLGALFGLAVAASMAILYLAVLKPRGLFAEPAEEVRVKIKGFGIHSLAAYLLFALFVSAIHSLAEEYYWRWFVFRQLSRGTWIGIAIVVSSLAFAAHHVLVLSVYFGWTSQWTWLFSAGVAIGGAVWAWLYHKSGSIYAPWLSHALVDAAIFAVGYDLIV